MDMWTRVFIYMNPRPFGTRDRYGARKQIGVGEVRAGVRAYPLHTTMFL